MDWLLLGFQLGNLLLLISWIVLLVLAIRALTRRRVAPLQYLLWLALCIGLPIIGAAICIFYSTAHYPLSTA